MNEICEQIPDLNQQAWSERNRNTQASLKLAQQVQTMLVDCPEMDTRELVINLRTQAYCLDHLGRYSEALTTSVKAIELADGLDDQNLIAHMDNVLGSIYWHLADYSSSLRYFMHGLKLIQLEPDPELEIFLVQGLGVLHYEMGEYEEALKYFKRSIGSVPPQDMMGQATGLNNIAYTMHVMKENEEALVYGLQALGLFGDDSYSVGKLEALHTVGSIYLEMHDVERAAYYFEQAVQAAQCHENILQIISALLGICQVHQIRGELEAAEQKLIRVLQMSKDINSLSSQCGAHEQLAKLYKQMGNYQTALEHHEFFHAIHVQVFNKEAERRLHNAQVLLEVEALQKQANVYRTLAATDALTGLLSRREFFELGAKVILGAQHRRVPVSLLMVDLDNFKFVNDEHGHAIGDQVLATVATRLKNTLRQDDLAGRYGGDEFVILMPEISLQDCQKIAQRCHNAIVDEPVEVRSLNVCMNVSIGLAVLDGDTTLALEDLIEQADRALLFAKKNGRNRIVTLAENHVAN